VPVRRTGAYRHKKFLHFCILIVEIDALFKIHTQLYRVHWQC